MSPRANIKLSGAPMSTRTLKSRLTSGPAAVRCQCRRAKRRHGHWRAKARTPHSSTANARASRLTRPPSALCGQAAGLPSLIRTHSADGGNSRAAVESAKTSDGLCGKACRALCSTLGRATHHGRRRFSRLDATSVCIASPDGICAASINAPELATSWSMKEATLRSQRCMVAVIPPRRQDPSSKDPSGTRAPRCHERASACAHSSRRRPVA